MPDPVADRVAEHAKHQRKRGLVRATVWVPKGQVDELKRVAARMRKSAGLLLPSEEAPAGCVPHGKPILGALSEHKTKA